MSVSDATTAPERITGPRASDGRRSAVQAGEPSAIIGSHRAEGFPDFGGCRQPGTLDLIAPSQSLQSARHAIDRLIRNEDFVGPDRGMTRRELPGQRRALLAKFQGGQQSGQS